MHATRAAVEEGIVPGGGVALVRAAKALEKFNVSADGEGDPDEQIGVNIVRRAVGRAAASDRSERRQGRRSCRRSGFVMRRARTSASTRRPKRSKTS
jgi:hypothetical protein